MSELAECIVQVRARYGFKLFERQVLQYALAEAMIAVYAMAPVLLRVSRSEDATEQATALLACARLRARARLALDEVKGGDDGSRADWVAAILSS